MAIQEIIVSMERLIELHTIMVSISEHKKNLIIKNQVDELSKLLTQETRGIKMIDEEERRRLDAVTRFLFSIGITVKGKIATSELAKLVRDPEQKQKLMETRARLVVVVQQLKQMNELNERLVEQSLKYINFSMDLMCGPSNDDYIYAKPSPNPYETGRRGGCEWRA